MLVAVQADRVPFANDALRRVPGCAAARGAIGKNVARGAGPPQARRADGVYTGSGPSSKVSASARTRSKYPLDAASSRAQL